MTRNGVSQAQESGQGDVKGAGRCHVHGWKMAVYHHYFIKVNGLMFESRIYLCK